MCLRYVDLEDVDLSSDMFLFRPLYRSKEKCSLIKKNKPISYTTASEFIFGKKLTRACVYCYTKTEFK
jgi:hypothetical protein